MKLVRMFTGDDGRTQFSEIGLPSPYERERVQVLRMPSPAGDGWIRRALGASDPGFHTAPAWRCLVILDGAIELISTSRPLPYCGLVTRPFEDLTGEGHRLEMHGCREWTALFLPVQD